MFTRFFAGYVVVALWFAVVGAHDAMATENPFPTTALIPCPANYTALAPAQRTAALAQQSLTRRQALRDIYLGRGGFLRSAAYRRVIANAIEKYCPLYDSASRLDFVNNQNGASAIKVREHLYEIFSPTALQNHQTTIDAQNALKRVADLQDIVKLSAADYMTIVRQLEFIRTDAELRLALDEMIKETFEGSLKETLGERVAREGGRGMRGYLTSPLAWGITTASGFFSHYMAANGLTNLDVIHGAGALVMPTYYLGTIGIGLFHKARGRLKTWSELRKIRKSESRVRENLELLAAQPTKAEGVSAARGIEGPVYVPADTDLDPRDVEATTLGLALGPQTAGYASKVQQAVSLIHASERWAGLVEAFRAVDVLSTKGKKAAPLTRTDAVGVLAQPLATKANGLQQSRLGLGKLMQEGSALDAEYATLIAQAETLRARYLGEHEASEDPVERDAHASRVERLLEREAALRAMRDSLSVLRSKLASTDTELHDTAQFLQTAANDLIAPQPDAHMGDLPPELRERLQKLHEIVGRSGKSAR